jgi:hypothetical protein
MQVTLEQVVKLWQVHGWHVEDRQDGYAILTHADTPDTLRGVRTTVRTDARVILQESGGVVTPTMLDWWTTKGFGRIAFRRTRKKVTQEIGA